MTSERKHITFRLEHNEDRELTCVVCYPTNHHQCEWIFIVKGDGRTTAIGVHDKCIPRLYDRNPQPT
jgi:hypothetical protein